MAVSEFQVPLFLDFGATLLWAVTGSLVAVRRGCDIVGVGVIALASSLGGGLLRDGLFLNTVPVAISSPYYLATTALGALLVVVLRGRLEPWSRHRTIDYIDALGMGAFAVVGMERAIAANVGAWGAILVGVVNAVGGGMLRDILVNEMPAILKPSQFYSLPVLAGCVVFFALVRGLGIAPTYGAWITIGFIFAGRVLTIRFNWRTYSLLPVEPAHRTDEQGPTRSGSPP